ncbi:cold-shock protein [Rhizobium sp. C4]|uniref:cold-shock protein n=1 Tax=Rhizobium sp. C4 TaxID=1349800 RepID=UPI001E2F56F8|nr:cold-shock protein [Rhizobium sp. C4]MCD2172759.1 cold-shock protein [Rhizobium sp. C4]
MTEVRYNPDDMVVLRPRSLQGVPQQITVRIVSCQPETTTGAIRYRVRLPRENFDRTISSDDIDVLASPATGVRAPDPISRPKTGSSWINASTIRTRK